MQKLKCSEGMLLAQKKKRKIFSLSNLSLLLLLTFVGCAFWAKNGYDYYTAEARLPKNMLQYLGQTRNLHFQNLDSLASFVELHREFAVFDDEIQRFKIDKKHTVDFARAYDGDTVAFSWLLSAMNSKDDWEVLHLFFVLSELDSVLPAQKLKELIKVSHGNKRDNFQKALKIRSKQNAYNIEHGIRWHRDEQASKIITEPIERKLKFNPDLVESLLRRGIDSSTLQNFRDTRNILDDILKNGNGRQYCRAREIVLDLLPFDRILMHSPYEDIRSLLVYQFPDDTINESNSVQEVLFVIKDKLCNVNAILLEKKINFSPFKIVCGDIFVTDNKTSLQKYSNLNGVLRCRSVRLAVYEDYANVSINSFNIDPYWKENSFYLSKGKLLEQQNYGDGGSILFHLQRINGVWKEIGMRIESVS